MESLSQYSRQQGKKPSGQFAATRYILDNPDAKAIFLKVAKEAEQEYISDVIAAQYLVDNYKQFQHLNYNTVRRTLGIIEMAESNKLQEFAKTVKDRDPRQTKKKIQHPKGFEP